MRLVHLFIEGHTDKQGNSTQAQLTNSPVKSPRKFSVYGERELCLRFNTCCPADPP